MDQFATRAPIKENSFPLPAIICIAIGAYVVLMILILVIKELCQRRGFCPECGCTCFGKEGTPECCVCFKECAQCTNCCQSPNMESCLDRICFCCKRQKISCQDIISCQWCEEGCCQTCCTGGTCACGDCGCQCTSPDCQNIDCCCCTCELKGNPQQQANAGGGYGGQVNTSGYGQGVQRPPVGGNVNYGYNHPSQPGNLPETTINQPRRWPGP